MRHALAATLLAGLTQSAYAQCQLGAPAPIADAALRRQQVEEVPWGYLSPILTGEYGQPYTLVDPLHPRRQAEVANGVKLAVVTAGRGIAVEAYQGGKLFAGPLAPGAKLTAIHEAADLRPVLDAVDGAAGETWVVLQERGNGPPGLYLYRINAAGKIGAGSVVARGNLSQARIARLDDGRLAVAFARFIGGRRYGITTLSLAWLDKKAQPLGDPLQLDGVLGQQPVLDVALATSGKGVVVAWNPIVHVPKGKVDRVPVELRAFHADPGSAPRLVRRDSLSGLVWHIPEAGGILPNQLQAASVNGQAVLIWEQLVSEQSMPLLAAPAEGGAPSIIAAQPAGNPLLRSDGNRLVVLSWDRNAYHHARATLTCKPGLPAPLAPLDPPPATPSFKPLTRADLDKVWKHLEELHAPPPADRAAAEARLSEDEGRFECLYDCVMATHTLDELGECDWP